MHSVPALGSGSEHFRVEPERASGNVARGVVFCHPAPERGLMGSFISGTTPFSKVLAIIVGTFIVLHVV